MMKRCCTCGCSKPNEVFGVDKARKDGLNPMCKACQKICAKKYRTKNAKSISEKQKIARERNPGAFLQSERKYRENNILKRHSSGKKYRENNRVTLLVVAAINRVVRKEKIKAYNAKHYQENKPLYRHKDSLRIAMEIQATPKWLTAIQLNQIAEMYDVAVACNVQTGIKHHVDHIMPLKGKTVRGLHVPWNLQVISMSENFSKNNRMPPEGQHMAMVY